MRSQIRPAHHGVRVLKLDQSGLPISWLTPKEAIYEVAQDAVAWSLGETAVVFHGGVQRSTGEQSILEAPSIIAVRENQSAKRWQASFNDALPLRREFLFRRDRCVCAYCGHQFSPDVLTIEHIQPKSKGGLNRWMNVVTACKPCNQKKSFRTPEEARMPLLYLPYIPNRFEHFILAIKEYHILGDQMDYLMAHVSSNSRLLVNV